MMGLTPLQRRKTVEVLHLFRCSTHTPRRAGLFSEESARQSKKSEIDAARLDLKDQEVELSSRRRIAREFSRSNDMLCVVVDPR